MSDLVGEIASASQAQRASLESTQQLIEVMNRAIRDDASLAEQAASAASTIERTARQMLDITRAFELTRLAARSETARQVA